MNAKTISGSNLEEVQRRILNVLSENQDFQPTLAIVFMSIKQDIERLSRILDNQGIAIFGSTTAGEFINSEISEGGITVMLLNLNRDFFDIAFYNAAGRTAFEISKQLGVKAKTTFNRPAFIVGMGWMHADGEEIINGIEEGFGRETTIFGGLAGDDLALENPTVFTNGARSDKGIIALIVDEDKVKVNGVATCGWKPIGTSKTVTRSEKNVVYTIDDQPALDMVIKYLGLELDEENVDNTVMNLGAYYPLQMERENAPPVIRTAMWGNMDDRSLICAGHVPQGSKVRFSLPPDFDVIEIVVEECSFLKSEESNDVDAVIMFSCISRYLSFGLMTGEEIEKVKDLWDAPFIGFFSYGEFGKSIGGKHEFHNNTCCVVTLKEINP